MYASTATPPTAAATGADASAATPANCNSPTGRTLVCTMLHIPMTRPRNSFATSICRFVCTATFTIDAPVPYANSSPSDAQYHPDSANAIENTPIVTAPAVNSARWRFGAVMLDAMNTPVTLPMPVAPHM